MVIVHVIILVAGGTFSNFLNFMKFYPNPEDKHIVINACGPKIEQRVKDAFNDLGKRNIRLCEFQRKHANGPMTDVFEQLIYKEKPDVVHVGVEAFLPAAYKAYAKTGIPFVGVWHESPTLFEPNDAIKKTLELMADYPIPQYVVSDYAAQTHTQRTGFNNFKTLTYGIDREKFIFSEELRTKARSQLKIPEDALLIGSVGRMYLHQKRNDWIVEAIDYLRKKSHSNVYGIMVGNGPDSKKIKTLVKELGLTKQIIFTGWQKNPTQLYCAMDIFAHPSRHESFGQVYAEALNCNLPVVTCAEGPLNSPIKDAYGLVYQGINGLIAHVDDQQEFFDALEILVIKENLRKSFAAAARDSVKIFDVRVMACELYDIFVDAAQRKGAPNLTRYEALKSLDNSLNINS